MHIWHLIDTLEVGGAEIMVATLCRSQKRAGLVPAVHCLARGGKIADILVAEGIPVRVHGVRSLVHLAFRLRRLMLAEKPDVVHCHNEAATIAGAPAAAAAGVRTVVSTRHGLVPPKTHLRREVKFWLAARFCQHVVAVCKKAQSNLAQGPFALKEKLVTIYNSAAPAVTSLPDQAQPEPICSETDFVVINVARHSREKDLYTLLAAHALAVRSAPSLRLVLAGDGPLTPALRTQADELGIAATVVFLGERRDIGRLLAQSKLFVLSSISEGLPISLLEAMAAGVPQVVTNVGGMAEVLEMSRGGLVVPPSSPEALADAILKFVHNEDFRQECASRSRDCYQRQFLADRMASDYFNLYTTGEIGSGPAGYSPAPDEDKQPLEGGLAKR